MKERYGEREREREGGGGGGGRAGGVGAHSVCCIVVCTSDKYSCGLCKLTLYASCVLPLFLMDYHNDMRRM